VVTSSLEALARVVVLPVLCAAWTLSGAAETILVEAGASIGLERRDGETRVVRLDAQACNTTCQERYTDCIDRCDGVPACQTGCNREVESCVKACSAPPSGSGAPPPGAAPSSSAAPAKPGKGKANAPSRSPKTKSKG
jgi:hypothetical protein